MRGIVTNIVKDRGFGHVKASDGRDYFFHRTSFMEDEDFLNLEKGNNLEFEVGKGRDGRPAAFQCRKVVDELTEYLIENALTVPNKVEDYDVFCDNAKAYAERLKATRVTTSMIRKIYARILAAEDVMELKLLRPQFAYTAGRNEDNQALKEFMEILDSIVKSMKPSGDNEELNNFKQFMEAIVAYRKYVGDDRN